MSLSNRRTCRPSNRDVHLAMQYIREHGTEPLKVSHLAKVLGISRRKLEQNFLRVTGTGHTKRSCA